MSHIVITTSRTTVNVWDVRPNVLDGTWTFAASDVRNDDNGRETGDLGSGTLVVIDPGTVRLVFDAGDVPLTFIAVERAVYHQK